MTDKEMVEGLAKALFLEDHKNNTLEWKELCEWANKKHASWSETYTLMRDEYIATATIALTHLQQYTQPIREALEEYVEAEHIRVNHCTNDVPALSAMVYISTQVKGRKALSSPLLRGEAVGLSPCCYCCKPIPIERDKPNQFCNVGCKDASIYKGGGDPNSGEAAVGTLHPETSTGYAVGAEILLDYSDEAGKDA